MAVEYIPLEHFRETDDDHSSVRIRDMPYGRHREALTLYPSTLNFGNMRLDKVSPEEAILLSNVGYENTPILEIVTVGDFLFNGPYLSGINAGQTIALNVVFHPQQEGAVTGGLYVTAPTAVGSKFATLTGFGVLTEDNLMQYPLLTAGKETSEPMNIANGVYTFQVSNTFDGASVQLQWRVDSLNPWIGIPNTTLVSANTIHGIPLNTGQARAFITPGQGATSLNVMLMW